MLREKLHFCGLEFSIVFLFCIHLTKKKANFGARFLGSGQSENPWLPQYHMKTSKSLDQKERGRWRGELKDRINRKSQRETDGGGQENRERAHIPATQNRETQNHEYPCEDYANQDTDYRDMQGWLECIYAYIWKTHRDIGSSCRKEKCGDGTRAKVRFLFIQELSF